MSDSLKLTNTGQREALILQMAAQITDMRLQARNGALQFAAEIAEMELIDTDLADAIQAQQQMRDRIAKAIRSKL